MLLTTHALTGAFLATKINNPLFSYPLIFASHFFMDHVPHWDFGTGLRDQKGNVLVHKKNRAMILGLTDLSFGLAASFVLFRSLDLAFWGGVFLSLTPDFLEVPPLFFNYWLPIFEKIDQFHSGFFHRSQTFVKGIVPQLIIIGLILYLTLAT